MYLPDQLWTSRGRAVPDRQQFQPPTNDPHGLGIKPSGGLWTSTLDMATGSGWVQWCLAEDYGIPGGYRWHAYRLVPMRDADILEIDSYADLKQVIDQFGTDGPSLHVDSKSLDFVKLAQTYDAIHLTENGQWTTRLTFPHTLYGWDCESVLWLHWAFSEVHDLGIQTWGKPADLPRAGVIRRARRSL
jgi:hypothetical protein